MNEKDSQSLQPSSVRKAPLPGGAVILALVVGAALGAGLILGYQYFNPDPFAGRILVVGSARGDTRAQVHFVQKPKDGQHEVTCVWDQLGKDGSLRSSGNSRDLGVVKTYEEAVRQYGAITWGEHGFFIGTAAPSDCYYVGLTHGPQASTGSFGWRSEGKDSPPGIDCASLGYGGWGEGMAVVVWSDFAAASGGGSVSGGLAQITYDHQFVLGGQSVLDYQCRVVEDGKTGKIKIGGRRTLDLADGSLILVSTAGGGIRLKQLKRDTLKMKPEQETFKELARTDSEISAFFGEGRQAKPEKPDTDLGPMTDPEVDRRAYEKPHE